MATTTAEPKKRRRKTRTKNVSHLEPLVASELKTSEIDLTPGKEYALCPACKCWTPITGVLGTPVLVPHHTTPYHDRTPGPRRRCSNTNRRIILDLEVEKWQEQLAEVSASVATRRPTKVLPKPVSAQTNRVLRGRDRRGPVTRRVEWAERALPGAAGRPAAPHDARGRGPCRGPRGAPGPPGPPPGRRPAGRGSAHVRALRRRRVQPRRRG